MLQKKPLVSIITVVYNGGQFLEKTIQSVLNQTYKNVEYIIIDGGSTDKTVDIIKKYENKIDYWVSERDNGIYDAMNKGIVVAHGKWINFMNTGDCFYNDMVLEKLFANGSYGGVAVIYGATKVLSPPRLSKVIYPQSKSQKYHHNFFHQSSFTLSSIQKRYQFNTEFKIAADADFFVFLYHEDYKFFDSEEIISVFRLDGLSNKSFLSSMKEEYIIGKKYNKNYVFIFLPTFVGRLLKDIIKKSVPEYLLQKILKLKGYSS